MTKNFGDEAGKFLTMLTNVDTCWNDNLTESFVKTVNFDQSSLNDLMVAINKQISISEDFCDELQSAVGGYFDITTLYNIKYIESTTDRGLEVLDIIQDRIGNIQNSISSLSIPYSSSNRDVIYNLLNDIDISSIRNTKQKVSDAVKAINHTINNYREKAQTTEKYEMDSTTIKWRSTTVSPELSRIPEYREKNVGFIGKVAKANLNGVQKEEIAKTSFNGNTVSASLDSSNIESPKSHYGFNGKTSKASIDDLNKNSVKKYNTESKIISANLDSKSINEINSPHQGLNSSVIKANLNDFNSSIEHDKYSYSGKNVEADIKSGSVDIANDYSYNKNTIGVDLKGDNVKVNSDYSYNNNVVKAQTSDIKVDINSNNDNIIGDNTVNNKEYYINDDNNIE